MNRPKVSLTILLPWEKAMAYCWRSTIQIYYSPHSLSAKIKNPAPICRLLEHLRTTTYQEENVRVKTWPQNLLEGKGKEETLLERSNSENVSAKEIVVKGQWKNTKVQKETKG